MVVVVVGAGGAGGSRGIHSWAAVWVLPKKPSCSASGKLGIGASQGSSGRHLRGKAGQHPKVGWSCVWCGNCKRKRAASTRAHTSCCGCGTDHRSGRLLCAARPGTPAHAPAPLWFGLTSKAHRGCCSHMDPPTGPHGPTKNTTGPVGRFRKSCIALDGRCCLLCIFHSPDRNKSNAVTRLFGDAARTQDRLCSVTSPRSRRPTANGEKCWQEHWSYLSS